MSVPGEEQARARRVPLDLVGVAGIVVLTAVAVFVPPLSTSPVRPVVAFAFLFVTPGYVVVAALFPGRSDREDGPGGDTNDASGGMAGRIDRFERVVLSFGVSVAVVALSGMALGLSQGGIRTGSVFTVVAAITLVFLFPAALRRRRLPAEEQFGISFAEASVWGRAELLAAETPVEAAVNVALIGGLLLATVTVGLGYVSQPGGGVTEFYLLAESEDGTFDASSYPSSLSTDEGVRFVAVVDNREGEQRRYEVVVLLQQATVEEGEVNVTRETEVDRFSSVLAHNESERYVHTVRRPWSEGTVRLVYLLYVGEPPADPTVSNAYRELHLWFDTAGESGRASGIGTPAAL